MNNVNEHTLNNLKKRFVSDYNLPIIIFEEPDFEYFLNLYEEQFSTKTKWDKLINVIDEKFNGNPNLFLEEFARVRNNMIESILNNKYYQEFNENQCVLSKYNLPKLNYPKSNVYKETNNGRYFLSVDLKKANFSALMYHDSRILGEETIIPYEDWVKKFTDLEYIIESKYTRQVVFGKLNPSRQIKVENYMIYQALQKYLTLFECLNINVEVASFCTDEVVFDVTDSSKYILDNMYAIKHLQKCLKDDDKINVDVEFYRLSLQKFKTYKDAEIPVYMKTYLDNKERGKFSAVVYDLFSVPSFYYAQVYKLIHGMRVTETDMKFYMEGQIARFYHPLIYVNSILNYDK